MTRQFKTWKSKPKRPGRANGLAPRAAALRTGDRGREGEPPAVALMPASGLPRQRRGLAFTAPSAAAGQSPWSKSARTHRMRDAGPAGNLADWAGPSPAPRPAALVGFCANISLGTLSSFAAPVGLVGTETIPPRGACLRSAPIDSLKRPTREPPPVGVGKPTILGVAA